MIRGVRLFQMHGRAKPTAEKPSQGQVSCIQGKPGGGGLEGEGTLMCPWMSLLHSSQADNRDWKVWRIQKAGLLSQRLRVRFEAVWLGMVVGKLWRKRPCSTHRIYKCTFISPQFFRRGVPSWLQHPELWPLCLNSELLSTNKSRQRLICRKGQDDFEY